MARTFEEMMQGYDTFVEEQASSFSGSAQNLQDEQLGFWGYVGDIAAAPFRGIEGAVQGVYNLTDFLTFDALPDYDNRLLGRSSTMAGGIVEGISQFAIPFVGVGLGAASKLGQVSKVSGLLTKAEKAAGTGRKAAAIAKGRELGKYATAGAITDFAVFDAHEARLSDLIQMAPSLQNPITEYLASDEDDSEIEGRLKNAIEGLGIGGMVDVFVQSLRGFRAGMKARAEGKSAEEVMQAAQDGVVDMKRYQKVVDTREYTSSIAKSLNIGDDQATGVVSLIDSLGLSRDAIQFERFDPDVDQRFAQFGSESIDTEATRGLVQFQEDGTALITGFRNSNVSTGIHEVAHVARRWLLNRNLPEQARRGINEKELNRIEKWAGVKDSRWDVSSEEKFARGFERYIREGKAPTKGLQGLFTKLGGWMRDIYQDVSNSPIAGEINDDFRTVMDSMLTRKGLPARPAAGTVQSLGRGAPPPTPENGRAFYLPETRSLRQGMDQPMTADAFRKALADHMSDGKFQDLADPNKPLSVASWFSGMGTMEAAFSRGVKSIMAVELEPKIMDQFNTVHGTDYTARSVFDVQPEEVANAINKGADLFHCSPVCKSFSKAKNNRQVLPEDLQSGEKIVEAIRETRPPAVTIENVPDYRNTVMFENIVKELESGGYKYDVHVIDGADYGGIQKRRRVILRGSRVGELPPLPDPTGPGDWYASLKPMLDEAPVEPVGKASKHNSAIPNWEIERIKSEFEAGRLDPDKPIITMGGSAQAGRPLAANAGGPAPTLKASPKEVPRVLFPDGSVKRITGPMMNRLMGLPDGIQLPSKTGEAKLMLGNGMEAEVTLNLIEPLAAAVRKTKVADDVSVLRQSDDETFDLSRHMNEIRSEAEALPGEVVQKTPRMRAAEIAAGKDPVGGVVNAPRVSEDEGVMRMVARYGLEAAPAVRQTVSEGIESAVAKAKELSVTHRTITGEGSWIGHLADNPQAAASMAQDQLEEALIKATSIDMAYRKMADDMAKLVENPEGAGEDEIFKFLAMEADFRSLMNASVNIGRMEARALGNRRFVGFVDMPRDPMPKELVELPPEARVVDEATGTGRGDGEGTGTGTGTGRGDGEGTGTGTGVSRSDAKAARRQIIESQGDGDYATGLKRIRSRMNKVKDSIATDHAKGLAVFRKKDNMLVTYWMNAILSGPSTHLVNMASGLATTLFLPLERAIGRGIDEKSLTAVHEELSTYMYLWQSVGDAFGAAKVAFKQNENLLDPNVRVMEYQPNSLATKINPDADDMATTAKKYMASLVGAPSRFLTAEDEFFKQLNYRAHIKRNLYKQTSQDPNLRGNYRAQAEEVERQFEKMIENDQMYSQMSVIKRGNAEAANQGLEPGSPEYLEFTKDYFQKNWNENLGQIAEQARSVAREATFTTPLTKDRGVVVGVSRGVQEIVNRYPGLRFMVPFVRTPTNLLKFYLDRSPVALKELLNPEFRKSMSSDPKVRHDFYGRMATGTMGLFGTLALAKSEMITGKGPDNKHERDLLIKSGWQPYSIKDPVTGGWISYRRLDPFATFLGLAADLNEAMNAAASNGDQETSDQLMALIPAIAIATGKNVASKSYLTGMVRVFDAVSNPTKGGQALIEQTVASFIPAAVSQTGTAFGDGDLREVHNTLDAIRSRIPGLSADLDPRRNFLGQTLQAPGQGELYNPFTYMTGGGSFVAKEIANVGHGFQPPNAVKNGVDLRTFKNNKGQSSYDRWLELQGSVKLYGRTLEQELTRLFKSTQYKRLPESDIEGLDKSPRVAAINRVVAKYRAKAFSQMLREYPEVQRRDEIGLMIKQNRRAGRDVSQLLALIEDTR